MASFDSSLSEADRMAQGACDGAGTTESDYVSSGGFIGTGPDSAQHEHYRIPKHYVMYSLSAELPVNV